MRPFYSTSPVRTARAAQQGDDPSGSVALPMLALRASTRTPQCSEALMSTTVTTDDTGGPRRAPGRPPAGSLRGMSVRSVIIWAAVAAVGAVAWTVLALVRGETVSALWIL